jgi:hypothetical protein
VLDRLANLALPSHSVLVLPSPYREVGDHFGDQNVRSTFAGFSLRGEAECVMSAVGLYAVGFQMSRNSKNKNPTRTTIFRGSNTQLSVL